MGTSKFFLSCHHFELHHHFCYGFFDTFEEAEACILEDNQDHFECGWYQFAVIEEVAPGSHSIGDALAWYKATYEGKNKPRVEKMLQAPPQTEGICHWWA